MNHGFTLIELLVVAAIAAVFIGGSVAGYGRFNETQRVKQAALTFKNNLRLAQEKAKSAQKPSSPTDCVKLVSYSIVGDQANQGYKLVATCFDSGGNSVTGVSLQDFELPDNINFQNYSFTIQFLPLTSGVVGSGTFTLVSTRTTTKSDITISDNGEINITNH